MVNNLWILRQNRALQHPLTANTQKRAAHYKMPLIPLSGSRQVTTNDTLSALTEKTLKRSISLKDWVRGFRGYTTGAPEIYANSRFYILRIIPYKKSLYIFTFPVSVGCGIKILFSLYYNKHRVFCTPLKFVINSNIG